MRKSSYRTATERGRFFRYAPLILWIGVVLFASTNGASMSKTSIFVRPVLEFLFPNTPEDVLLVYHHYIRKAAHLAEYAILAYWAVRAFSDSAVDFLKNHSYICAVLLVVLIALIDETNQSFNPLRTGSPWDVLVDICGALLMISLIEIYKFIFPKRRQYERFRR